MTTEILFMAEEADGISFFHQANGSISDEAPPGEAVETSLVYSDSEIDAVYHGAKVSRRGAALSHNVDAANVVVGDNMSWAFSDVFFALREERRKKTLPLGAVVWYWANQFFGEPADERQIILTIGQLERPITYVITLKDGQVKESILHGLDANKLFSRACKEVVHLDLLFDRQLVDAAVDFTPPAADKSKAILVSRFLSEHELRPVTIKREAYSFTLPWSFILYPLAAFSFIYVGLYFSENHLQEANRSTEVDIEAKHKAISYIQEEIKQELQSALSFYISRERKNINSTFETINAAAQILPMKDFSWDSKGVHFNTAFNINVGALRAEQIRQDFIGTFPDCQMKETHSLGGSNEIFFSFSCLY